MSFTAKSSQAFTTSSISEVLGRVRQLQQQNDATQVFWSKIANLIGNKLWHELSLELSTLYRDQNFLSQNNLFEILEGIVYHLKAKLDSITYLQLIFKITSQIRSQQDVEKLMNFCTSSLENDLKNNENDTNETNHLYTIKKLTFILTNFARFGIEINFEEITRLANIIKCRLSDTSANTPSSLILFCSYLALSLYYLHVEDHTRFYNYMLTFLHLLKIQSHEQVDKSNPPHVDSCDENDLQKFQLIFERENLTKDFIDELCKQVCTSALIAPGLFSFGELLRHPIAQYISSTPNKNLLQVVEAFNNGDIKAYQEQSSNIPSLGHSPAQNKTFKLVLEQKVRMMSLLTLIYETGANLLSFDAIARRTHIDIEDVDLLVIKCIADGLIDGTIDQLKGTLVITNVRPRVLTQPQMNWLANYFQDWAINIDSMSKRAFSTLKMMQLVGGEN